MTIVLDPTAGRVAEGLQPAKRASTLEGKVVALLDISKPRGDVFLNQLQTELETRGLVVKRYKKPTFAKPAPVDLRHEIATNCDAVIEALAD
jgi:hypothetical protein